MIKNTKDIKSEIKKNVKEMKKDKCIFCGKNCRSLHVCYKCYKKVNQVKEEENEQELMYEEIIDKLSQSRTDVSEYIKEDFIKEHERFFGKSFNMFPFFGSRDNKKEKSYPIIISLDGNPPDAPKGTVCYDLNSHKMMKVKKKRLK